MTGCQHLNKVHDSSVVLLDTLEMNCKRKILVTNRIHSFFKAGMLVCVCEAGNCILCGNLNACVNSSIGPDFFFYVRLVLDSVSW